MRYQGGNPQETQQQNPSSNFKKPMLKISGKDNNGLRNGVKVAGHKVKGSSSISLKKPEEENNNYLTKIADPENVMVNQNGGAPSEENGSAQKLTKEGSEVLQWCKRKRPRGSRPESRASSEDPASNGLKIGKSYRQAGKSEKQISESTVHSRNTASRPPTPLKESNQGFAKRRFEEFNVADGLNNGNSQKLDKHPPVSHEKSERGPPMFSASANTRATELLLRKSRQAEPNPSACEKKNTETLEWPRILLTLSRKEKEQDFLEMKGSKLPQRPKKRPKCVERALQNCYPGSWLSDVSKARYEVKEKKCVKKKSRGLKAMESSQSDSE